MIFVHDPACLSEVDGRIRLCTPWQFGHPFEVGANHSRFRRILGHAALVELSLEIVEVR